MAAALLATTPAAAATTAPGATGYDVSYPQCGQALPSGGGFGVVGVNDGLAWSLNPCLGSEYAWAATKTGVPAFYMNTANPGTLSSHWTLGGPRPCTDPTSATSVDDAGCAYDYGWNAAAYAYQQAVAATSSAAAQRATWWADVETGNSWNGTATANAADVQGGLDYLRLVGVSTVGVYSTSYQWGQITGGAPITGAYDWVAGMSNLRQAQTHCGTGFGSAPVLLVQYPSGGFDGDYRCP